MKPTIGTLFHSCSHLHSIKNYNIWERKYEAIINFILLYKVLLIENVVMEIFIFWLCYPEFLRNIIDQSKGNLQTGKCEDCYTFQGRRENMFCSLIKKITIQFIIIFFNKYTWWFVRLKKTRLCIHSFTLWLYNSSL